MKSPFLTLVTKKKPARVPVVKDRLWCFECNDYPTVVLDATVAPEKNAKSEKWLRRSGEKVALCGDCMAKGKKTIVGRA